MAITFVNAAATENAASATYTVVLTWAQTAGDCIVVNIWTSGLTQTIISVKDTSNNSYYQAYPNQNANAAAGGMQVTYVCANAAAAASSANTVTVKFGASQATATVGVMSFNSDDGFGYVDVLGTTATGTSTSATKSITTVNANTLVIGFITTGTGGVTTVTSGTSALITATNKKALAYAIRTTAGSQAISATVGATNDRWVVGVIAIQKTAPTFTGAGVPTLVQSVSTAACNAVSNGSPFFIDFPNKTLANNCLIAKISYTWTSTRTITVTDDQGQTWTAGATVNDGANFFTSVFYKAASRAGVNVVTFTFDAAVTQATFNLSEWYNIATSSITDGNATTSSASGPMLNSGSFTPATSGDLIIMFSYDLTQNANMTGCAPAPGFKLMACDAFTQKTVQYTIQKTAAAINPGVSVFGTTDTFNVVAFAFKAATSGTAPSSTAMRIVNRYAYLYGTGNITLQFPTVGNLFVMVTNFGSAQQNWTANTTPGQTWTNRISTTTFAQLYTIENATPLNNFTVLPTVPSSPFLTFFFYDIVNASTTPYDSTAGVPTQSLSTTAPGPTVTFTTTFTPSTINGIVFGFVTTGTGPITGVVTPSNCIFDSDTYTGENDSDFMCNADCYSHLYNTSISALTWEIDIATTTSVGWCAIAFQPPPGGVLQPGASGTITTSGVVNVRFPVRPNPRGTVLVNGNVFTGSTPLRVQITGASGVTWTGLSGIARVPVFPAGEIGLTLTPITVVGTFATKQAQRAPINVTASVTGGANARFQYRSMVNGKSTSSGVVNVRFANALFPTAFGTITTSGHAHGSVKVPDFIVVTGGVAAARSAQRAPVNAIAVVSGLLTVRQTGTARLQITGLITSSGVAAPRLIGQMLFPTASGTLNTSTANTLTVRLVNKLEITLSTVRILLTGTVTSRFQRRAPFASNIFSFGTNGAKSALRLFPLLTGSSTLSSTTLNARGYVYPRPSGLISVVAALTAREMGTARVPITGFIGLVNSFLMVGLQPTRIRLLSKVIQILNTAIIPRYVSAIPGPPMVVVSTAGYYVVLDAAGVFTILYMIPGINYIYAAKQVLYGPYPSYNTAFPQLYYAFQNLTQD